MNWKEALKGKKFLLVEDDVNNQDLICDILDGADCLLEIANDSEEGLAQRKKQNYDVILMDLHMPKKTGYECAKEIRQYEAETNSPRSLIFALTADILTSGLEECKKAGMDGYISKPISVEAFRNQMAEASLR